jgi:hypothetical protein
LTNRNTKFKIQATAFLNFSKFFARQNNRDIQADSFESVNNTRERLRRQNNGQHEHMSSNQDPCPICLNRICFCIETNCAHKFCGKRPLILRLEQQLISSLRWFLADCMFQYWNTCTSNRRNVKIKCPMCRQFVTCLLTAFTRAENRSDDYKQTMDKVNEYNRKFSNAAQSVIKLCLFV